MFRLSFLTRIWCLFLIQTGNSRSPATEDVCIFHSCCMKFDANMNVSSAHTFWVLQLRHPKESHTLLTILESSTKIAIMWISWRTIIISTRNHHHSLVCLCLRTHFVKWKSKIMLNFFDCRTGLNAPLYRRHDEHSVFGTLNINSSVSYWHASGLDKDKIVVGLPTYGHSFR